MAAISRLKRPLLPTLLGSLLLIIALRYRIRIKHSFLLVLLRRLFGLGHVRLTSPRQTITFKTKSSSASNNDSAFGHISLRSLVEKILIPLRLNPFLFNGHIQTICTATGTGGKDAPIYYKRRTWESDDKLYPGTFTTDFVIPSPANPPERVRDLPARTHHFEENEWSKFIENDSERPLVIVIHGFLGGSHEKYIRHALELLVAAGTEATFSVAVINARGCAYSRLTSPYMYHPQATWDVRQFVKWARAQWPRRRLFAVGFSIGANLLCNYLGEEEEKCELEAAVLVANPWNLDVTNTLLANSTLGLQVYQRALGTAFKKAFKRNLNMISKNVGVDVAKVKDATFLWEWDRFIQSPIWGYPSETAYYRDTSSVDAVSAIKIPVLAIHAEDDPVCSNLAVPYDLLQTNPYVIMCTTSIGGHLGWFEFGGGRWSNKIIDSFLRKLVTETNGVTEQMPLCGNGATTENQGLERPVYHPTQRKLTLQKSRVF